MEHLILEGVLCTKEEHIGGPLSCIYRLIELSVLNEAKANTGPEQDWHRKGIESAKSRNQNHAVPPFM